MNEYWYQKKQLSKGITNKKINEICKIANMNGAYGVKLLGAGGGGFIYILCPPKKKKKFYLKNYQSLEVQIFNSKILVVV